jgi:hypothetical protein
VLVAATAGTGTHHLFAEDRDLAYEPTPFTASVTPAAGGYRVDVRATSYVRDLALIADKVAPDAVVLCQHGGTAVSRAADCDRAVRSGGRVRDRCPSIEKSASPVDLSPTCFPVDLLHVELPRVASDRQLPSKSHRKRSKRYL